MSYELKKVYESYKAWILHIIMSFVIITLAFSLTAIFFRLTRWLFTY
jgi:hypothetical protein